MEIADAERFLEKRHCVGNAGLSDLIGKLPLADRLVHLSHVCVKLGQGYVSAHHIEWSNLAGRLDLCLGQKLLDGFGGCGMRLLADRAQLVKITIPAIRLGILLESGVCFVQARDADGIDYRRGSGFYTQITDVWSHWQDCENGKSGWYVNNICILSNFHTAQGISQL